MCSRHLQCLEVYTDYWHLRVHYLSWETNLTRVRCVTKVSVRKTNWTHINDMFTATEDHITVLTVTCNSRQTVSWSVMFMLTQVQSRTHIDTVQPVWHHVENSSVICWSYTMKVIASYVRFARSLLSIVSFKSHLRRHEGVKSYVCSVCPKHFCTADELKDHELIHTYFKQFCCGLCGNYEKLVLKITSKDVLIIWSWMISFLLSSDKKWPKLVVVL